MFDIKKSFRCPRCGQDGSLSHVDPRSSTIFPLAALEDDGREGDDDDHYNDSEKHDTHAAIIPLACRPVNLRTELQ